jgi:hypothetical protein
MEIVLTGLQWDSCLIDIDDVIIFRRNFEEELKNLEMVFDRLSKAGLKLKAKKCNLFQRKVVFLGHVVSKEGIATDPKKIKAIQNWPVPQMSPR